MVKLCCFGVYDEKAKAFLPPWFMPNVPMALRTFSDCVNDAQHQFGRHPADYTLFSFGFFETGTGKFDFFPAYELVANGVMCKEPNGSMVNGSSGSVVIKKDSVHENA